MDENDHQAAATEHTATATTIPAFTSPPVRGAFGSSPALDVYLNAFLKTRKGGKRVQVRCVKFCLALAYIERGVGAAP